MNEKSKLVVVLVCSLLGGLLIGYGVGSKKGPLKTPVSLNDTSGACVADTASPQNNALFVLDGKNYSTDDLSSAQKNKRYEMLHQNYHKESSFLDEMALTLHLALKKGHEQGLTDLPPLQDLLPKEDISEKDTKEFFEKNKNRIPPGTKYAEIKDHITKFLQGQKVGALFQKALADLKKSGQYKNFLSKPISPEIFLDITGYPVKGPKNAKYTLVEASDYTCPHCKTIHEEVEALLKKHGDKIQFVQMNFALRPAGLSGKLIEGAYCAHEQGNDAFWAYHQATFTYEGKSQDFLPKNMAKLAKIKMDEFEKCLTTKKPKDFVEKTNNYLSKSGINSTPSFFLNNKKLVLHGKSLIETVEDMLNSK